MRRSVLALCIVIAIMAALILPVAAAPPTPPTPIITLSDIYKVVTAIQTWTTTAGGQLASIVSALSSLQSDVSSTKSQVNQIYTIVASPTPAPVPQPIRYEYYTGYELQAGQIGEQLAMNFFWVNHGGSDAAYSCDFYSNTGTVKAWNGVVQANGGVALHSESGYVWISVKCTTKSSSLVPNAAFYDGSNLLTRYLPGDFLRVEIYN
jgi:hypothetical protein